MAPEQREKEELAKAECIAEWQSDLEKGTQPLHISVETLRKTIWKLKAGKGSSDGIITEVFWELDESNSGSHDSSLEPPLVAQHTATNSERGHNHTDSEIGSRPDPQISDQLLHCSLSESWWDTSFVRHHPGTHSMRIRLRASRITSSFLRLSSVQYCRRDTLFGGFGGLMQTEKTGNQQRSTIWPHDPLLDDNNNSTIGRLAKEQDDPSNGLPW